MCFFKWKLFCFIWIDFSIFFIFFLANGKAYQLYLLLLSSPHKAFFPLYLDVLLYSAYILHALLFPSYISIPLFWCQQEDP